VSAEIRLFNRRSHVLHRYPAWESCNTDAIPHDQRLILPMGQLTPDPGVVWRFCKRCFSGAA